MFGAEPEIGSAVVLWLAAAAAALAVLICVLSFDWTRLGRFPRAGVAAFGGAMAVTLAWAFVNGAGQRDQNAERRALELRAAALDVQALAPGSSLACLNGLSGANVEAACEKALFAAPATVAAGTAYVAARLALLQDVTAYLNHGGGDLDGIAAAQQRMLETDRFGFLAHMLALRDGCTSDNCKALALLRDPSRVRANIVDQTLDRYLDRYASAWNQQPQTPVADATPSATAEQPTASVQPTGASPPNVAGPRKSVDIDFPSASSIPAVSIMNPEPKGGPAAAAAAAAGAAGADPNAQALSSPKRARSKQASSAPPPAAAAPPPVAPANPIDPVWTPAPRTGAPASAAPPEANAGAARAQ
jgi:hypothetical protein